MNLKTELAKVAVDDSPGEKRVFVDSSFCWLYSITLWLWAVSCMVLPSITVLVSLYIKYIFCLELVEVHWVSGFNQSFGTYQCQKLICRDCRCQPSESVCLEERVICCHFILFWSECRARSLHFGDASRGVVFVILVDEVSFGWVLLYIHRNHRLIYELLQYYYLLGMGAQDGHLNFHTVLELWGSQQTSHLWMFYSLSMSFCW